MFAQDALELCHRGRRAIAERLDGFALDRLVLLLPDDTDQGRVGGRILDLAQGLDGFLLRALTRVPRRGADG